MPKVFVQGWQRMLGSHWCKWHYMDSLQLVLSMTIRIGATKYNNINWDTCKLGGGISVIAGATIWCLEVHLLSWCVKHKTYSFKKILQK